MLKIFSFDRSVSHSWSGRPPTTITVCLQTCAWPPSPWKNPVGPSASAAVWTGPGPAAAGGPAATPAVPGETQTAVPTAAAAAHHQQGN